MICDKYDKLNPVEKVIFIGQLVHVVQSDSGLMDLAEEIIKLGLVKGLLTGVTILPDTQEKKETDY